MWMVTQLLSDSPRFRPNPTLYPVPQAAPRRREQARLRPEGRYSWAGDKFPVRSVSEECLEGKAPLTPSCYPQPGPWCKHSVHSVTCWKTPCCWISQVIWGKETDLLQERRDDKIVCVE